MHLFLSPHFLAFCLVQAVKWVAAVVIHNDGMVNVALTEATLPMPDTHLTARTALQSVILHHDPHCPAILIVQQELSIVFQQDWRQLLGQGQVSGGGGVVYFYSNGSATANRGAEVCKCRAFLFSILSLDTPQVIHQLHRAVLDCGIESFIEQVRR